MRRPASLKRIVVEAAVVLALHWVGLWAMVEWRVLEKVLSPTSGTTLHVAGAFAFIFFRMFVLLLFPGWLLARIGLWALRRRAAQERASR